MGKVRVYSEVLGREVEVPEEPERIVSLAPSITETLYEIGVWDRVVGVSLFCNKPGKAREKPRVGAYLNVNYKLLEELKPDLVLVTTGAQRRIIGDLVKKGYTVYPIPLPVSVYGILENIVATGIVVGRLREARRLAARLAGRLEKLRGALSGLKIYYEISLGGPVTAGGHSYITDALSLLGAETPFSYYRVPWITNPDPEVVRRFNPEIIVYELQPGAEKTFDQVREELRGRLGDLEAIRRGRIVVLQPDSLAHYGPSIVYALEELVVRARGLSGIC